LARAQADSDNGLVSAERRAMIRRGVQAMLEELPDEPLESAPASPAPEVCCLAGRNELDEAGALLLAHLLGLEQQIAAKAFPAEALSTDADGSGVFAGATLICLSLLSTSAPARARFIVRRLRRRAPRAKILVAFWAMPDAEQTVEEAAAAASADFAAYSLRDAVAQITRMSRGIGADRPVPEVPISAANGAT
jgi:hypothetical protein